MPKKTEVPFIEEIPILLEEIREEDLVSPIGDIDSDTKSEKLVATADDHAKRLWTLSERFEAEAIKKMAEGVFSDSADGSVVAVVMRRSEICRNLFWIHIWEKLSATSLESSEIGIRSGWEIVELKRKEAGRPQSFGTVQVILGIPSFEKD